MSRAVASLYVGLGDPAHFELAVLLGPMLAADEGALSCCGGIASDRNRGNLGSRLWWWYLLILFLV